MFLSAVRPSARVVATRVAPRIASSQLVHMAPRVMGCQLAARINTNNIRFFSIGDQLKKKETVEEERYIREQEKKFYEKKRAEKASSEHDQEMAVYEEVVAPAMVECQELLKASGDTISDAGLELLAKWKLGMKK